MFATNSIQRFVPFWFMIICFAVTLGFTSIPPLSLLSVEDKVLFWIAELSVLIALLKWLQDRVRWPAESISAFASKTLQLAFLASLIAAVPSLFIDIAFGLIPAEQLANKTSLQQFGIYVLEYAEEVVMLFLPCTAMLTLLNWLHSVGIFRITPLPAQTKSTDALVTPEFWTKMEKRRHGKLLALEAQQHYLLVHTTAGTELIHYSFGKAVEELATWEGARVHRSFWVARKGIAEIVTKGRDSAITLITGAEIPISRARKAAALAKFKP